MSKIHIFYYKYTNFINIKKLLLIVLFFTILFKKKYLFINNQSKSNNDLINIYPKINLNLKINKTEDLTSFFTSKILYINNISLTNQYILHIKKLHDKYEEKYNSNKKENLDIKTINNKKKYNWLDYYYLCKAHILIDKINNYSYKPIISIILPSYNKEDVLLKSVRSIQNQSFKNIEIIIVDDFSTDQSIKIYQKLLETDKRIRIFFHLKNMGVWRSRIDGLLYSRGKYIINFDLGDFYADNLVLEDSFHLIEKYKLDSIRFSFKMIRDIRNIKKNKNFEFNKEYTKIIIGHKQYKVNNYIHGPIWNRLIKRNILFNSLNLIDSYILNAYKNLWEDSWWNSLINIISYRNLMINRVGYLYIKHRGGEGHLKLRTDSEKDRTIQEIIYFWLFNYEILPKNDNKKSVINIMRKFNNKNNIYFNNYININFLKTNFEVFKYLLNLLINDYFVCNIDKLFIKKLLNRL